MPRLATGLLVSALVRRANAEGGTALVLEKGDATAGSILIIWIDRGVHQAVLERRLGPRDSYEWARVGPDSREPQPISDYLAKRRSNDPDLWIVELDIADGERFAAGMTGIG